MHMAFTVLYVWSGARADEKVVYGPRFAIYTPVIQLADGSPALDTAAGRPRGRERDRPAVPARAARPTTAGGRRPPDQPVRVLVDGEERAVADDGTFAGGGAMALVRQGPLCTRIAAGTELPFTEPRLA